MSRFRPFHLLVFACLALAACRSAGAPPEDRRTPIEKPWTKSAIEAHEYVWLEMSNHRRGFMTGPVLEEDEKGRFLTTKHDPSVHLPLDDVVVLDAISVPPPRFDRTPIEKPWTKDVVEAHEHVWVETAAGQKQLLTAPTVASDAAGAEYVTTKTDPSVHVPLSDVVVLDSAEQPKADASGAAVQSLGGSVFALWTAVVFFVPAILLVVLLT